MNEPTPLCHGYRWGIYGRQRCPVAGLCKRFEGENVDDSGRLRVVPPAIGIECKYYEEARFDDAIK